MYTNLVHSRYTVSKTVYKFSINVHNSVCSIYKFFQFYTFNVHSFSKIVYNSVYLIYTNFQNMYTILYIQITQNFKECTQFSTFMVHYFSKKKCTQLYTFNVHNFF